MSIQQSVNQTYQNQQVVAEPIHVQRQNQFFDLFHKHRIYEIQGRDNNAYLGPVDIYHLNQRDSERIREAKSGQLVNMRIDNCGPTNRPYLIHEEQRDANGYVVLSSNQYQILNQYPLGDLPKWIPERVAVKTINVTQQGAEQIRTYVEQLALTQFWNAPEFVKVLGYQVNGSEVTLYIEFQNTLENDIAQRKAEKNPFSEELLWKLLHNLTAAASKLSPSNTLTDVRPSRVFYADYQASVLPHQLTNSRDAVLVQKFQNGEPIFYSNEILNDFNLNQSGLRQSQSFRNNFNNESFQIGLTILAAGLLLTEQELGICANRGFNAQQLEVLLEDFGRIYGSQDRLLQFTLQELFLFPTRQSPTLINSILNPHNNFIIFLNRNFKDQLRNHFSSQVQTQQRLTNLEMAHPPTERQYLPIDFWYKYPSTFHYHISKKQADDKIAEINRSNALVQSQVQTSTLRASQQQYQTTTTTLTASQQIQQQQGQYVQQSQPGLIQQGINAVNQSMGTRF